MSSIFDYGRLSWTVKRLNQFKNDPRYNLEYICIDAGIDYTKVSAFLEIANGILDNKLKFKEAFDACGVDVQEITVLSHSLL